MSPHVDDDVDDDVQAWPWPSDIILSYTYSRTTRRKRKRFAEKDLRSYETTNSKGQNSFPPSFSRHSFDIGDNDVVVVDREFSGIQMPYRTYGTTMCGVAVEGCSTPNTEYLQYVSRYYYCSLFQILQDDYDADAWSVTVGKVCRAMHWRSPGGLLVWWGRGNVMWLDDASRGIP